MNKIISISEERHIEVLDVLLADTNLMVAVNASENFEAGYQLVAQQIPGLTQEEFAASIDLLRQIILAQMEKTRVQ